MIPEQALQVLKNLSNICVKNGGILNSIDEAATISLALNVLENAIAPDPVEGEE